MLLLDVDLFFQLCSFQGGFQELPLFIIFCFYFFSDLLTEVWSCCSFSTLNSYCFFKFILDLPFQAVQFILEVILFLLQEFMFPRPERLETQFFLFLLHLVLFEYFDWIVHEFNVAHFSFIIWPQPKILNPCEPCFVISTNKINISLLIY